MITYLQGIWNTRFFWTSLVWMDLRTRYHGTVLGLGWSLLHPLAMTAVIAIVFCPLLGLDFRTFAPYLLVGMAFWNHFSSVVLEGCHCFLRSEAYIRQHPAPLAIYPLRVALGAMVHCSLTWLFVLAVVGAAGGVPNLLAAASLVPALAFMMVFAWGLATLMGLLNTFIRDTYPLAQIGLQVCFYLTPVIYPQELVERRGFALLQWNPLTSFLELFRAPILRGTLPDAGSFLVVVVTTAAVMLAAVMALRATQRKVIFCL